jgi:hypothetical protein
MNFTKIDSPELFFQNIPKSLDENIEFRKNLHRLLAKDTEFQKTFLQLCKADPRIMFNAVFWVFEPRPPIGPRNFPFILRPNEEDALLKVNKCVNEGRSAAINKTREEGATETLMKYSTWKFLLFPETVILWGSRTEELVDKSNDPMTLFAKIDYAIKNLPPWWRGLLHLERTFKNIRNLDNGSSINGEATSAHFGASKRATFVGLDEFGQVEPQVANSIEFSVFSVSNCIIYNSTHFYGPTHAFARVLDKPGIERITMMWYNNPVKNEGLYESTKVGEVTVLDKKYYLEKRPEIFTTMDLNQPFDYLEFSKKCSDIVFIADGGEKPPISCRSPWHDKKELELDNYRSLCMNLWAYPTGASDMYFDAVVNSKIRRKFCKPSKIAGEIVYSLEDGKVVKPIFKPEFGKKHFRWWGELINGRPNQNHNFIVACDIGFGTGASNSTAEIADVNTNELVGEYVTAEHDPADFAELVAALGRWVGGSLGEPYFIWERNGGGGKNFGRRLMKQGFRRVYTDTSEDTKTKKRKNRYGWTSTKQTKDDVLYGLKAALKESLKTQKTNKYLMVYSEELINELDTYIFYKTGEADSGEMVDLSSGARARHGDRVIGAALLILGLQYNIPAKIEEKKVHPKSCVGTRIEEFEKEEIEAKRKYRSFRYN